MLVDVQGGVFLRLDIVADDAWGDRSIGAVGRGPEAGFPLWRPRPRSAPSAMFAGTELNAGWPLCEKPGHHDINLIGSEI